MRSIAVVVFPEFHLLTLAGITAFEVANRKNGRDVYETHLLSERGGPVRSSSGITVMSTPLSQTPFDTVLVAGSPSLPSGACPTRELLCFLRGAEQRFRRVASIGTGTFALAEAGLLDGRSATTHWAFAKDLKARYPKVRVDSDRIFVNDGIIWTSAGMAAGIDLILALLEEDLGSGSAREIAKQMVIYHRRLGSQTQISPLLDMEIGENRVHRALAYAHANLGARLSVADLADVASLSPRQFSRIFIASTGRSPAKAVELLRMDAALALIRQGESSLSTVAIESGFKSLERMRRAFVRATGSLPSGLKEAKRGRTT